MVKAAYSKSARAIIIALCLAALSPASWAGDSQPVDIVKSALIYNFTKFVRWEPSTAGRSGERFNICILGQDPFGEAFDRKLVGRTVNGNPIVVVRSFDVGELERCNLLFVSSSEDARVTEVIGSLRDAPVLTVGETGAFFDAGGMIRLLVQNNKVRFDINATTAKRAGLKISSQLLKLARDVEI